MRLTTATRFVAILVCVLILSGAAYPRSQGSVTIDLGNNRALAQQFVQEKYGLSESAARKVVRHYEQLHGDRIADSVELPAGAVLDYVRVDGNAPAGSPIVSYEGSGIMNPATREMFAGPLSHVASDFSRAQLMQEASEAAERGWFVQQLTEEQRSNLRDYRLPGEQGTVSPRQATNVRILVVLCNFPEWVDRQPTPTLYDGSPRRRPSGPRSHPMHAEELTSNLRTPGGPLDPDNDFEPAGLSWSTGDHARIAYMVDGREGTSVDLRERWFDFLFNQANPLSITNYYWTNSNGNLRIQGNRSDIRGPLETKHMLDRIPYGGSGTDYAIQPGTPIIMRVPTPEPENLPYRDEAGNPVANLRGISADSEEDIVGTLGYVGRVHIGAVQVLDDGEWEAVDIDARRTVDDRRQVAETDGFDERDQLRVRIGGQWVRVRADDGWSLRRDQDRTTFTRGDVLGSEPRNRLLSMDYYTHNYDAISGEMGGRPYQLRHTRNASRGVVDDIIGTVDDSRDRMRRPYPYDHDRHGSANMGFFNDDTHNYREWVKDLDLLMRDEGINPDAYDAVINLYPSDEASERADTGGTSGWLSGPRVFIPTGDFDTGNIVLPSDAGLIQTAHQLGHGLMNWPDLYDWDWYDNVRGHTPPLRLTNMMGPYSVMARTGGVRVDAFLRTMAGWATPVAVTEDIMRAEIPEIEGMLQDPVIYKLPGRPHYIPTGVTPDKWDEYFLVSNRNRTGEDYFGDPSPRGLYIYHVDERFDQRDESHPMVIVVQADGLYELQRNPEGQPGDLEGDPFPGSHDVRHWTQFTNPSSHSHGFKMMDPPRRNQEMTPSTVWPPPRPAGHLVEGTATDSFSRVVNISDPGRTMRADLFVTPREVIVTALPIEEQPEEIQQGTENELVKHLRFDNDGGYPNLSMDDVEIDSIRIDEIGSSQRDADVERVSLFHDTDRDGRFDPERDTRIATGVFSNGEVHFRDLNFNIPLGEHRDLFVVYDISRTASPTRGNTVGAGMETYDYIRPEVPGAVQERERLPMTETEPGLGEHRFPIMSSTMRIMNRPSELMVTPISRAPGMEAPNPAGEADAQAIQPGDQNVPILSLNMTVDENRVRIGRIRVDQVEAIDAVAHITSTALYHDINGNGVVDPGDRLLAETTFAVVDGVERAAFDLTSDPFEVVEGDVASLLLTASISEDMPLDAPSDLVYEIADSDYITLLQHHPDRPEYHDYVAELDEDGEPIFPIRSDVITTPTVPEPPRNLRADSLEDGNILLEWDLSPDDPEMDPEGVVLRYNIYRSQDFAELDESEPGDDLESYAQVDAGETEFVDIRAPLGVEFYYMLRSFSTEGIEGPNSNIVGPISAEDLEAPEFTDFDPEPGAEDVPRDTAISFAVVDERSGVDESTLDVIVDDIVLIENGEIVEDQQEHVEISGTARRLEVTYQPPEEYDYLQTVTVGLRVADNAGNWRPAPPEEDRLFEYSFTTEAPATYSISGEIFDEDGEPVEGVTVRAGERQMDTTDRDGYYEITGLLDGVYEVTPTKEGHSFYPPPQSVSVPPDAFGVDFTAAPGFEISGSVVDAEGEPLRGVTITAEHRDEVFFFEDVSNADGTWAFTDVPAGFYDVRPALGGYVFEPEIHEVEVGVEVGSVTDLLFEGAAETFTISGTIRDFEGERLEGITVEALRDDEVIRTAETNPNGLYRLSDLAPGTYVVRPTHDDYEFQPPELEFELASDRANADFTAAALYAMPLPDGLAMVAVPVEPLDPDPLAAFGENVQVARWSPQAGAYVVAPDDDPLLELAPGRGYWTRTDGGVQARIGGEVFSSTQDLSVTAQSRWNMLGNPYDRDLPWERMNVPADGPVANYGFIWDREAESYRLVSTAEGLGAMTTVPRHHGFWLRATASAAVTFRAPGTAPASAEVAERAAREPGPDAWVFPVVARAADAIDASSLAGVLPQTASNPEAYRMDNPPALGDYVDLYFLGDNGRRLAVDVRENAPRQRWDFEVATNMAGAEVQIQLPDLSEVPHDRVVYLYDEAADKRIYARTQPSYSYDAGEGGTRRFRLEVVERTEAGLTISAASAQSHDGGATVSYTLSTDAHVRVEVLNIAGRTIAVLASDEAKTAGVASATWSGRSRSGTLVPGGRYLVRITARAEDGQQTQALVPLNFER